MGENASASTFPGVPPFSSCKRWYAREHEKITLSLSTSVEKCSHNSRSTRVMFVIFFSDCRVGTGECVAEAALIGDLPSSRWRGTNFGVGRWRFWVDSCRLWEAVSRKVDEISKFGLRRSIRLVALCNPDFFRVVLRLSHFRRKRKAITLEIFFAFYRKCSRRILKKFMGVDLDEANRMAQAKPRYLVSRRRYGRFIKINFSNLCRRSRFKCCLMVLATILLIRFDVESWNFRHKIWKAEGRKL